MHLHSITGSNCTTSDPVEKSQLVPNPGDRQGHKWPKNVPGEETRGKSKQSNFFKRHLMLFPGFYFLTDAALLQSQKLEWKNERINQFMPAPANETACSHGSGAGGGIISPMLVSPLGCRSLQHILANHSTGRRGSGTGVT